MLGETLRAAPVGARTEESALPMAPARRVYTAVHRWGKRTIVLQAVFDARGRIAGINLAPPNALPRDPHAGRRLRARLALPFEGTWWVFWGGPTERQNYHVVAPDQRHAYDLVVWRFGAHASRCRDEERGLLGLGTRRCSRLPRAASSRPSTESATTGRRCRSRTGPTPAGNHVVLDLGHGEYALLAHMQPGSVRVRVGDRVRRG